MRGKEALLGADDKGDDGRRRVAATDAVSQLPSWSGPPQEALTCS